MPVAKPRDLKIFGGRENCLIWFTIRCAGQWQNVKPLTWMGIARSSASMERTPHPNYWRIPLQWTWTRGNSCRCQPIHCRCVYRTTTSPAEGFENQRSLQKERKRVREKIKIATPSQWRDCLPNAIIATHSPASENRYNLRFPVSLTTQTHVIVPQMPVRPRITCKMWRIGMLHIGRNNSRAICNSYRCPVGIYRNSVRF